MSKFMAASKQAFELDHEKVRLEAKICNTEKELGRRMGERMKLEAKKQNEELKSFSSQDKDKVIKEFKSSKAFTDLLDKNYAVGFEDFSMNALELFLEMNFDSIKLRIAAKISLLQTSSKDLNVEDDASTPFLAKDDSKFGGDAPRDLSP
nr:hypothetical protein CFP56_29603 [Quercus suber]